MRSAVPHWLRPHPVASPINDLWRKTLDRSCTVFPDFFWLVLSPHFLCLFRQIFCAADSWLFLSPQRAHVAFFCWASQTRACFLAFLSFAGSRKTENSNLHGFELRRPSQIYMDFELRRPSSKDPILLFQVRKAIINQYKTFWISLHPSVYHVVEHFQYSGHSLHRLVVFVCWFFSKLLSYDLGACAPPLLLILI